MKTPLKLKPLKPSMKENKRYLLVRSGLNNNEFRESIEKAILEFIGVLGMSKTGLEFVKSEPEKNSMIIAVNRGSVDSVRASFGVWSERIEVLRVSGTLKGLRKRK